MSCVLAVDLGGSGLKAALFGIDGEEIAAASVPLAFVEDGAGRSEQDPAVWHDALVGAAGEIAARAGARFADVAAVAICGVTRTQVLLGADGQVLRPAIGFRDARAGPLAEEARAAAPDHAEARHLNAFHPLARLLWIRRHEPEVWSAVRTVLEPKDVLNLWLTGVAASDAISQVRLVEAMAGGARSLAARAGLGASLLPVHREPDEIVGAVVPGLPGALARLEGARVVCGTLDTWAAVAGLGAMRAGRAYCISGSSEVFGLVTDRPAAADGLITLPWGRGLWQIGGPGLNGANVVHRLLALLAPAEASPGRLDALLAAPSAARPLLLHPYLHGERVPWWDADLSASFVGLTDAHGPADMIRAAMEGVAFLNRTVLERGEAAAGVRADEVRVGGGGAQSAAWNQIRADVLARPVVASAAREAGLLGCLALARVALGHDPSLAAAAQALASDGRRYEPDPARRAHCDALYDLFRETHAPLAAASRRLAQIGRET